MQIGLKIAKNPKLFSRSNKKKITTGHVPNRSTFRNSIWNQDNSHINRQRLIARKTSPNDLRWGAHKGNKRLYVGLYTCIDSSWPEDHQPPKPLKHSRRWTSALGRNSNYGKRLFQWCHLGFSLSLSLSHPGEKQRWCAGHYSFRFPRQRWQTIRDDAFAASSFNRNVTRHGAQLAMFIYRTYTKANCESARSNRRPPRQETDVNALITSNRCRAWFAKNAGAVHHNLIAYAHDGLLGDSIYKTNAVTQQLPKSRQPFGIKSRLTIKDKDEKIVLNKVVKRDAALLHLQLDRLRAPRHYRESERARAKRARRQSRR